MELKQLLWIAKPCLLNLLQQRKHFARGVDTEFPFARFEAWQQRHSLSLARC